jgi:DNA polymerase III delta prime subunit
MKSKTIASNVAFLSIVSISLTHSAWSFVSQTKVENLGSRTNISATSPTLDVKQCTQAISATKLQLQKIDKLQIISIKKIKATQSTYINYPTNRPFIYSIIMSGSGGESIMNSPKSMKEISTKIISRCQSISAVIFGIDQTDWGEMLGIIKNEKIEAFKCIEPRRNISKIKLNWGTRLCV